MFEWKPEQTLLEKVTTLAHQRSQSPESIVTEAVRLYLQTQSLEPVDTVPDPLIGLFEAQADLATKSEDILQAEITEKSGWTWK